MAAELGGRLSSADIRLVIGTRPEAIKLAPVARALEARGLAPSLVLTGQHPRLNIAEFGLDSFDAFRLECPGEEDPNAHVRAVTAAMLLQLADGPDLLIVQGDTSSALGGALAGFTAGVAVAHVEAGLRTHDPKRPWPEEEYRTAIDAGAELLFAPTPAAVANLAAEQTPGEVHLTGNTGIDALLAAEARLPPPSLREGRRPHVLVTCHRRESWGAGLESIAVAAKALARTAIVQFVLHPNRHVSAEMRRLLSDVANLRLIEPASHLDLLRLVRDADLVLSDSGGLQEEAPALGVPLLVLRDKTERPEAVACGNARLVGTSAERILAEARALLEDPLARAAMSHRSLPFGDGRAAPRIAAIVADWLERRTAVTGARISSSSLRAVIKIPDFAQTKHRSHGST